VTPASFTVEHRAEVATRLQAVIDAAAGLRAVVSGSAPMAVDELIHLQESLLAIATDIETAMDVIEGVVVQALKVEGAS
jgi:hypothetical protein